MRKPEPPKLPSEIDRLLDRDVQRKYDDARSDYDDRLREYNKRRYGDVNCGPWGDGE